MTGRARRALVGREPVVTILNASTTAIVTGFSGSGLTSLLAAAADGHLVTGGCVVSSVPAPRDSRLPLSYLTRLSVVTPDDPQVAAWPGVVALGAGRPDVDGDVVAPQDLPRIVERTAREMLRAADGRPLTLVLDDLDAADALSLSVLPLLQRRLDCRLIGAGRAPAADAHPRSVFAAFIDRLDRPSRIHLSGLDDEQCLQVARTLDRTATAALIRATRPALGRWAGLPGLLLGVVEGLRETPRADVVAGTPRRPDRMLRLAATHPLVRELLALGPAAAVVASTSITGGLRPPDLGVLSAVLGVDTGRVARIVDALTAQGLIAYGDGCWRAAVPALARTLADLALPAAVPVALAARAQSRAELFTPRLVEVAERVGPALPTMMGALVDELVDPGPDGDGSEPGHRPLPPADLHRRLLATVADAAERLAGPAPGAVPAPHDLLRLPEVILLARMGGEERSALRILAAGTRLLRHAAAAETQASRCRQLHRTLARLRAVAATVDPPDDLLARDPRPHDRTARDGTARLRPAPTGLRVALADRTLTDAADGSHQRWTAAWARWQQESGVDEDAGPGERPAGHGAQGDFVRAVAGWTSGRELLDALYRRPSQDRAAASDIGSPTLAGPVEAFLTGDWDAVQEAAAALLPGPSLLAGPGRPARTGLLGRDERTTCALAVLVAVHRRDRRSRQALTRQLAASPRGRRPPLVAYALATAIPGWHDLGRSQPDDAGLRGGLAVLREELRRTRRTGPANGLDLLLFEAARINHALGRQGAADRHAAELDDLAADLRTPRAEMLAARALLAVRRAPSRSLSRVTADAPAGTGRTTRRSAENQIMDRLRHCLAAPSGPLPLGVLARAQTMVVLAEHLPPGHPEAVSLAVRAGKLLAPLQAAHWLSRARALCPAGTASGPGTRSRATAEHVHRLIGEGLTNRQISARLSLSEKSIEGYVTRLLRAHGCANRAELAARGRRGEASRATRTPA